MYSVVLMMALSGGADTPALGHRHSCCGCEGSYAASCGCEGSYGGCEGRHHRERHHRHHGCCGCQGESYGCCGYVSSCSSCAAPVSCGCCGSSWAPSGAPPMAMPPAEGKPPAEPVKPPKKTNEGDAMLSAPVTLVVSLPTDAKLMVDDFATKSTSSVRTFTSPALDAGKEYTYTLKGEMIRDGKTETTTKQVTVRAGEQLSVSMEFPTLAFAQK